MQTEFSVSFDRTTKVISAIACAVLLGVPLIAQVPLVLAITVVILVLSYAFSPRGYEVTGQSLVIKRMIGDVRIPLAGLREARRATSDDLRGCLRLMGSGGLFGYYGLFRTSSLGRCSWYVTDRGKMVVLLPAESKPVVLSPDDVDRFLAAMPAAGARSSSATAGSGNDAPRLVSPAVWVGFAIGVPMLLLAFVAIRYSPGPPEITLTRDSLTIHDRFYEVTLNASAVELNGVRTVDFQSDPGWRPSGRTNGFSNSHYHSGWYRVANGQKVRLYWANGSPLVLLPPAKGSDAAPVLLEVRDPARFLEQLRTEWGQGR